MPEHNLIQRPDLLLKLAQHFGIRQAHITPALNTGVQAVVIVADLRQELGETVHRVIGAQAEFTAAAGLTSFVGISNPPGSGVRVRPIRISGGTSTSFLQLFTPFGIADAADPGRIVNSGLGIKDAFPGWRRSFPISRCVAGDITQIANADVIGRVFSAGQIFDFAAAGLPIILEPGEGIGFAAATVASLLRADFLWREEELEGQQVQV